MLNQWGASVVIHMLPTATAADVKNEAVRKFLLANKLPEKFNCDTNSLMGFAAAYKLMRTDGIEVDETAPVDSTEGRGANEWLLIRKRWTASESDDVAASVVVPTQEDIDGETVGVQHTIFKMPIIVNIDELVLQSDVGLISFTHNIFLLLMDFFFN